MGKEEREEREEEGEDREEREKERERSDPLSFPQERREGLCLSLQGIQVNNSIAFPLSLQLARITFSASTMRFSSVLTSASLLRDHKWRRKRT